MAWYNTFQTGGNIRNKIQSNASTYKLRRALTGGLGAQRAFAAENAQQTGVAPGVDTSNAYQPNLSVIPKENADGSLGFDYSVDGRPISRDEFLQFGGDPTSLEQQYQQQYAQQKSTDTSNQITDAVNNALRTTQNNGTSGTLGYATLPNGRTYNLDNSTDRTAFFNDKLALLTQARDTEIAKGKQTSDQNLSDIEQQIQDTYSQAKTYVQDYNKNVNQFGENYQLGNIKRGAYFAGLSPNAFQSSQGSSQQYAENQYLQGLGDMAQEAQSNVGNDFLSNPNDISQIGANTVYGRNIGQLGNQKLDVANKFNAFLDQSQQDVFNKAADTASGIGQVNGFSYNRNQIAAPTANKADTSMYTPYTTFQQGNVQVPVGQPTNNIYTPNAFKSATPLDSFLGKNQLNTNQKDYLRSYLLKGQTA